MSQDIGNTPDLCPGCFSVSGGRVEILEPLTDTDHGFHEFTISDGARNLWTVGTYPGA